MNQPAFILGDDSLTVYIDGKSSVIRSGHYNWSAAVEAINKEDWVTLKALTAADEVQLSDEFKLTVSTGSITMNGAPINAVLERRLLDLVSAGFSVGILSRFVKRLMENPSRRSIEQLYPFLEHSGIPITPDGCFLAYKSVRQDFKDHHTGSVDNSPGTVVTVPRNEVSDDPKHPCHFGLHVGALEYASQFHGGETIVICKVDPKNVVSIPYDSSQQKMRVCEYEVVGIHAGGHMPDTVMDEDDEDDDSVGDVFDVSNLEAMTLRELRRYARKDLKMVNVNRVLGGKRGLVNAIRKTSVVR